MLSQLPIYISTNLNFINLPKILNTGHLPPVHLLLLYVLYRGSRIQQSPICFVVVKYLDEV